MRLTLHDMTSFRVVLGREADVNPTRYLRREESNASTTLRLPLLATIATANPGKGWLSVPSPHLYKLHRPSDLGSPRPALGRRRLLVFPREPDRQLSDLQHRRTQRKTPATETHTAETHGTLTGVVVRRGGGVSKRPKARSGLLTRVNHFPRGGGGDA